MHFLAVIALAVASLTGINAAPTQLRVPAGTPIPNQYIIVYKPEYANSSIVDLHESWLQTAALSEDGPLVRRDDSLGFFPAIPKFSGFSYLRKYADGPSAFRGYAARLTPQIAESLKALPEIDYIEQNQVASIDAVQTSPAAWGLRRISKAALPLPADYTYADAAGSGVDVYVIDTGIQVAHPQFGGRARVGASFSSDNNNVDGNGHGTHVAGTVGSNLYGVAKRASLIAVKVLSASGSGTNADVIAGINWVANAARTSGRPCVVNMSLGGGASSAVDTAVQNGITAGCTFVVAAGNAGGNACVNSPARAPNAYTVAASDINDRIATFSDRGTCVDIIAPGVNVLSTWIGSTTRSISGTSMASPHVAGVAAVAISNGVSRTPASVMSYLTSIATPNRITGLTSTTKNLLLQVPQ